jgi:HK97 family phage prohead protease/HK97 family phage major capsid protein
MRNLNWPQSLTIRSDTADGHVQLEGRAVPYDTPITVGGMTEVFARGSIDPAALVGTPLLWQHDTHEVIGRIDAATEQPDGAHFTATLIPTTRGKDAVLALRSGAISGLSIGFMPVEDTWAGDTVTRTKVDVREVSVATIPAYDDAQVLAIRTEKENSTMTEPTAPPAPAVDLSGLSTREDMTALEARIMTHINPAPAAPSLDVRSAFIAQLKDAGQHGQIRALADVLSSGNAGVLPPNWSSEVRQYVDNQRYTFAAIGSIAFPTSGYTLTIPKVTQQTTVAARGTEKTGIPTRALTTGSDTYTCKWFAGGVDIALELISQAEPAILQLVVESILGQYAEVTDKAAQTDLEAAATVGGATLDWTSWATASAQIFAAAEAVRAATGEWGDRLILNTASWKKLVGLMDSQGRRMFAPGGQVNADGSAPLLSRTIDIGGVYAMHNPRAVVDVQTNTKAARLGEKPPITISSDNVNLMGRDLGVLGATLFVPAYPAGIIKFTAAVRAAR